MDGGYGIDDNRKEGVLRNCYYELNLQAMYIAISLLSLCRYVCNACLAAMLRGYLKSDSQSQERPVIPKS